MHAGKELLMFKKIVLLFVIALILCGCSPAVTQQPTPPSDSGSQGGFSMQGGQISIGEGTSWPDYIPDDIPPIPAAITQIMADDYTIRIFFENMPEEEFEGYLSLLYQNGFSLDFIVYEQPGVSQDDIERYIREGKYDAVKITKGGYNMSIEYGAGMGTYDIDPKGFPEGTVIKTKVEWPAELIGILDPPADSEPVSLLSSGSRIEITCESDNENLFSDYCAQMEAQGYTKGRTVTDQNYNVVSVDYTKGDILVTLLNSKPGNIGIQYKPGGNMGTAPQLSGIPTPPAMAGEVWPEWLPESLPEFKDAVINRSMKAGEKTMIQITCSAARLDDYRKLLLESGFAAHGGDKYTNADCTVVIDAYEGSDVMMMTVTLTE